MKTQIPRADWIRALTAHRASAVVGLANEILEQVTYRHKALPQEGLGMLKMQDSVLGNAYYLGEFPLSCAWLELQFPDGRQVEGAGQTMSDSTEFAVALAICDGVLANDGPRAADVASLVEQGIEIRRQEDRIRNAMLQKTLVNFSALGAEEVDELA